MKKIISIILLFFTLFNFESTACSGWGHIDKNNEGNVILAKNRDGLPEKHYVQLVKPDAGYKYIGLFTKSKNDDLITKAGISEKGLTITTFTVSTVFLKNRISCHGDKKLSDVVNFILEKYDSVESVLIDAENLFNNTSLAFLMLADKEQAAYIEIEPKPNYKCDIIGNTYNGYSFEKHNSDDGYIIHTNYYLNPSGIKYNVRDYRSTYLRYDRLKELLSDKLNDNTIEKYLEYAHDKKNGPGQSLFRHNIGPDTRKTLATWIVQIPRDGSASTLNVSLYEKISVDQSTNKISGIEANHHQIKLTPDKFESFETIVGQPTTCE